MTTPAVLESVAQVPTVAMTAAPFWYVPAAGSVEVGVGVDVHQSEAGAERACSGPVCGGSGHGLSLGAAT